MHRNAELVVRAGLDRGVDVFPREFPQGTRTAADAAAAIGVELGQIVKSLVFLVDGRPVVALMSGSNRLDEDRLAAVAGGVKARRADANAAREATGFPIGGVPPFGHRIDVPVFVDQMEEAQATLIRLRHALRQLRHRPRCPGGRRRRRGV